MNKILTSVLLIVVVGATSFAQNTFPFPATGNVGIGTTSPNYGVLQIKGEGNPRGSEWDLHPLAMHIPIKLTPLLVILTPCFDLGFMC